MNDLSVDLAVGTSAVLVAGGVLLLTVLRELAPAGGLTGRGRWLLAAGLGAGVIAFAIKLALIGWLSTTSAQSLHTWAARAQPGTGRRLSPNAIVLLGADGPRDVLRTVWQALPREAPGTLHDAMAAERVALGQRLFNDKNLSLDRTVSCASCHDLQAQAGADGLRTALGVGQQRGGRNAPTVWNAAFQARLFWDGRAGSLEEQAKGPPINPIEMGMPSLDAVAGRVRENAAYRSAFARVFGSDAIDIDQIASAIAAYERTLITPDTAYDRFVRGDERALNASQLRGMALFEQVGCVQCHAGPNFSGASLLGEGAAFRLFPVVPGTLDPALGLQDDPGALPKGSAQAMWRIPSLRNVALTGPYFHNGAIDKLEDAVRIMVRSQLGLMLQTDGTASKTPYWFPGERTVRLVEATRLSERDVQDIVAFLHALSADELVGGKAGS